ncbi:MAG TPA: hypothetical protein VNQ33_08830, partial [Acidimicrobiales bacterium]|nr:hypothetical protein [Acidimicrobiales bacterium]
RTPEDRVRHDAVRAAARFVRARRGDGPPGTVPATTTHQAVLAAELHPWFLTTDPSTGELRVAEPEPAVIRAAVDAARP